MIGDFPNLGEVWFNEASIANILSLADIRKVCTVTMDLSLSPSMNVHRKDGSIMSFVKHPSGLYVYMGNDTSNDHVTAYTLLSTVAQHKQMFSQRQIQQADLARELYCLIGRPDEKEFRAILRDNLILNCPVTHDDASRALAIYGPDVATLKGKMTRTGRSPSPHLHRRADPASGAQASLQCYPRSRFFYVQGNVFLHTISRGIGYRTVAPVADRSQSTSHASTHPCRHPALRHSRLRLMRHSRRRRICLYPS